MRKLASLALTGMVAIGGMAAVLVPASAASASKETVTFAPESYKIFKTFRGTSTFSEAEALREAFSKMEPDCIADSYQTGQILMGPKWAEVTAICTVRAMPLS